LALHEGRSTRVSLDLVSMMLTIYLDHELCRYAGEVCEVSADRMLTTKFDAS
jgi:hypothetical protein